MSNPFLKLFSSLLLLFLLLQVVAEASLDKSTSSMAIEEEETLYRKHHHPMKINCHFACARRCSKASRRNVCLRACGTCCLRCHCVPPGTYGGKNFCPCYANLKTHGHKSKCP